MTYTPNEQAHIDTIRRMFAAETARDWETVYSIIAPDCVDHASGIVMHGHDEQRALQEQIYRSVPDAVRTLLGIAADGETVVFRWQCDATFSGSGKRLVWEGASWCLMRNGQIAESWQYADRAEIQRQMTSPAEGTAS